MALAKKIKNCIKWFVPYGFIIYRQKRAQKILLERHSLRKEKEKEIKNYFLNLDTDDPEILEIIDYVKKYGFSVFPYEFYRKYHSADIDVFFDKKSKMRYVMHENKRLYFPEDSGDNAIRSGYNGLCIEQDKDSPHCYETNTFVVSEGDVIVEVGAAEGTWALNNVEKAQKIYLFECTPKWIKALQKTFEPWKEKVVIVNKYVSNINDNKNVTLDKYFDGKRIDFIKADIEGMGKKMLEGSRNILSANNNLKLSLCTYHLKNDAIEIKEVLEKNGFKTEYSKGYMLFIYDNGLEKPYIRRGLIRAVKNT